VGVVIGTGDIKLLPLRLFDGGQATGALMLLAQIGGLVVVFVAGLKRDIDRMREASVTDLPRGTSGVIYGPFLLGAAIGHLLGRLLADSILPGRSSHRYERLECCSDHSWTPGKCPL